MEVSKEVWEHFQNLDKEVEEITKHIDTEKMWEEIRVKHNIPKEEWAKMSSAERFAVECPQGVWHYEEDELEDDPMDKADQWYDEWQDEQARLHCGGK